MRAFYVNFRRFDSGNMRALKPQFGRYLPYRFLINCHSNPGQVAERAGSADLRSPTVRFSNRQTNEIKADHLGAGVSWGLSFCA